MLVENDPVLTTIVSRKAKIKLSKKSEAARKIERALREGKEVRVEAM